MIKEIKDLYVYTSVVDGEEKIIVGADGAAFIFVLREEINNNNISEQMQAWSNTSGINMKLIKFTMESVIDVIVPMKTHLTM